MLVVVLGVPDQVGLGDLEALRLALARLDQRRERRVDLVFRILGPLVGHARERSGVAESPPVTDRPPLAQRAASLHHPLARALLVLTFTTGLIDAVSFLGLGRVFIANMTGNVVFLGFGIAGADGLTVLAPLARSRRVPARRGRSAACLGARLAARHPEHMARTLAIEVALLLVACDWCAAVEIREDELSAYVAIVLLALAMGVRNATVRKLAVPDLTTTVLSLTLTGLAAESPPAGGTGRGSTRRIAAVGAMLLGALAGALMLEVGIVAPARRRGAARARDVARVRPGRAAGGALMPSLALDVPLAYDAETKRALAERLAATYAAIMDAPVETVTVAIHDLGPGGVWRFGADGAAAPGALLMCDVRRGRPLETRAALCRALVVRLRRGGRRRSRDAEDRVHPARGRRDVAPAPRRLQPRLGGLGGAARIARPWPATR